MWYLLEKLLTFHESDSSLDLFITKPHCHGAAAYRSENP